MTSFVVGNNAESTVADNPLAQAATTLNVAAGEGANFPSTFPFLITLWDETAYLDPTDDPGMEVVRCMGRATDALTIVRAQEGTADVAHALAERVAMLITAGMFNDATYGITTKLDNIEDNADVTDATNVNTAGAVMESDIPDQSFTNLLENGDFESWSAGVSAAPDGWALSGAGASVARNSTPKIGTYCTALTGNGANAILTQGINDPTRYQNKNYVIKCWVKSTEATRIYVTDGYGIDYSNYHSGGGAFELLTVSGTVNVLTTYLNINLTSSDTYTNTFDGAILVEGSVCPAFSPKPLVDDGKTFAIDSANNKVTLGNLVACTPSSDASITAAGGITVTNSIMRVAGNGGAINITADPQIVAGSDGEIVTIQGTHDTNTVTLDNGTGLALSAQIVLAKNDNIKLMYDSGESVWVETSRTTVA